MRIEIPFGKQKIDLDIPDKNILHVISDESINLGLDEDKTIIGALENPIKSKESDVFTPAMP